MSRKLILASAMTMALAGTDAFALGLGGLNTQSALNQPFLGEIELQDAQPDEIDAVKASLASSEAFAKAGVERYYYLTKLTFKPERSPQGGVVLRVSSREPIREPYMDFLVEVTWPAGKLLKEYTVLLDPPVLANRGAPAVRGARAGSARAGNRAEARSSAASSNYIPAPGDGFPIYVGPVRSGVGLWRIANEARPSGATVAQTAMALYRNNQQAFIRSNINRLRVGTTLVIPTGAELFALDAAEAEREYAAALRGRAVRRSPLTDIPPGALDSRLRVAGATSPGTATAPASMTGGSSTEPGIAAPSRAGATPPAVQQDVLLALETSESTRQETLELRERIKELETQLSGIESLLQLRNAELARAQNQPAPGVLGDQTLAELGDGELAALTQQPMGTPEGTQIEPPLEGDEAQSPLSDEASSAGDSTQPTEADAQPETSGLPPTSDAVGTEAPGLMPLPVPSPAPEDAAPSDQTAEQSDAQEPPNPVPTKPVPPVAPPVEAPASSTWHSLLLPLAGLAAVTVIGILVFSWVSIRRKRREEGEEDHEHDKDLLFAPLDETTEPRTMAASEADVSTVASPKAPEESAASGESSSSSGPREKVEETGVTLMSSLSNFDAETDEADPLAEADIYIAYGRHSEAQDLLLGELKRYPDRADIKYKLAEAYAGAKDLQALGELLSEIEAAGDDQVDPRMWSRLQEAHARLRSATDSQGESGGTAQVRDALQSSGGDAGGDSMTLGVDDSFSLDISDLQQASIDSADRPKVESGIEPATADSDFEDNAPLKISDDLLGDILSEPRDGFVPDSEQDSFGAAPTVSVPPTSSDPARDPREDSVQIESELVLSLDDRRVEVVEDLDSIFDSTAEDEPTLARNEASGTPPTGPQSGQMLSSVGFDSTDSVEQESTPTDLLSSQWQMDSGIWDETATKLDLARAYIEMDDAEAAREILEEVVAEGRDEQRSEARAMLSKLG
ncbi:FimV/HubP family polar landmark protein [Thiorhodococcus fuscus]|uniref:FimV/HubP family polar landmark protein n=1 Tax=Thiorhodococcus fuscus TaxID=527200 RepID=A0ABW4YBL3_9GAMM